MPMLRPVLSVLLLIAGLTTSAASADDGSYTYHFEVQNTSRVSIVVKNIRGCPHPSAKIVLQPKGQFNVTCPLAINAAGQLDLQRAGYSGTLCRLRIVNLPGIYVERETISGPCAGSLIDGVAMVNFFGRTKPFPNAPR